MNKQNLDFFFFFWLDIEFEYIHFLFEKVSFQPWSTIRFHTQTFNVVVPFILHTTCIHMYDEEYYREKALMQCILFIYALQYTRPFR